LGVNRANQPHPCEATQKTNLTEWGWLERASAFIASFREGLGAKGLDVTSLVWRTNPNCPVLLKQGAVIVSNFSKLSAEAVRKEAWGCQI